MRQESELARATSERHAIALLKGCIKPASLESDVSYLSTPPLCFCGSWRMVVSISTSPNCDLIIDGVLLGSYRERSDTAYCGSTTNTLLLGLYDHTMTRVTYSRQDSVIHMSLTMSAWISLWSGFQCGDHPRCIVLSPSPAPSVLLRFNRHDSD